MRRFAALTAGLVLVLTTSGAVAGASAAPASHVGIQYNSATEYVCWFEVRQLVPELQTVYVGDRPSLRGYEDICSRATGYYLRQEVGPVYWTSSSNSVLSVGSAGTYPVGTVTLTATGPGFATVTATARRASYNYTDLTVHYGLQVYERPLSVSVSGPGVVYANYGVPCTWYASTLHGTAPFRYAWYRNGSLVSSQSTYSASYLYSAFSLQVQVTDATNTTVTGQRSVSVSQSYSDHC